MQVLRCIWAGNCLIWQPCLNGTQALTALFTLHAVWQKSLYLDYSYENHLLNDSSNTKTISLFMIQKWPLPLKLPHRSSQRPPCYWCTCHVASVCIHTVENNRQARVSTLTWLFYTSGALTYGSEMMSVIAAIWRWAVPPEGTLSQCEWALLGLTPHRLLLYALAVSVGTY